MDVFDDSRKRYRCPWVELRKYGPRQEPIRTQDSLPCPLRKKLKNINFFSSEGKVTNLAIWLFLSAPSNWLTSDLKTALLILILYKKYLESYRVRYLVTIEIIDGTFIHLLSEFSQKICSWWTGERNFQFYNKYTLSVSLSMSVQFGHLYSKLHNGNWRNSMRKEPHKIPLCLVEMPHLNLVFVEERPDLHTPLQQTNEQILTTLKLKNWNNSQLLSLPFTNWTEVRLFTSINRR